MMDCDEKEDVPLCYVMLQFTIVVFFIAGRTQADINLLNDPEIKEIAEKG